MTTVWIYIDTRYHPGHPDHLKVFANPVAADDWQGAPAAPTKSFAHAF
jgi:hypothetical protein